MSNNLDLFEHMSIGKLKRCLAFCKAHDWGKVATYNGSGSIDNLVQSEGDESSNGQACFVSFRCFNKLRAWAGY